VNRSHVATVRPAVARALLRGVKRIETRFYRRRRPPCGRIARGDRVHFKLSGGGLIGTAQVVSVKEVIATTPAVMDRFRREYGAAVHAPAAYWTARRRARFGVLIWLGPLVAPPRALTVPRQYGSAWLVLRDG
jgi:hypothetical protein